MTHRTWDPPVRPYDWRDIPHDYVPEEMGAEARRRRSRGRRGHYRVDVWSALGREWVVRDRLNSVRLSTAMDCAGHWLAHGSRSRVVDTETGETVVELPDDTDREDDDG